jgi:hypothetical protein
MRFLTLKDQTVLPVERIRRQFRNEEVRSVLPARLGDGTTDSLLVATTSALAIITGAPDSRRRRWMTRWAPWDAVQLGDHIDTRRGRGQDVHHLAIGVDRLRFESTLPGEIGLRAMRDFVDAAQARQSELAHAWAGPASIAFSHPAPSPAR